MESKTFRFGFSTRYRYPCQEEPASSKHQPRTGPDSVRHPQQQTEPLKCLTETNAPTGRNRP